MSGEDVEELVNEQNEEVAPEEAARPSQRIATNNRENGRMCFIRDYEQIILNYLKYSFFTLCLLS